VLKWNDHHALFFIGAEELCEGEEYTDVTLAAGTKFFPAHKLILSICSPYFRQLFKKLGRDKTVIYLKDVDPNHLDLLLQYMYKGEIRVKESDLVSILRTAQGLDIRGLSEDGGHDGVGDGGHDGVGEANDQQKQYNHHEDIQIKHPTKRPSEIENSPGQNFRKKPKVVTPATTMELPPVLDQVPVSEHVDHQVQDIQHDIGNVNVKTEVTQITIDLDGSDQGGSLSGFEGLNQEMAFIDTSCSAGFEGDVTYEEGQYYEETMEHMGVPDDRVGENIRNCPYCSKTFHKVSSLKQHLPVHTKEKNFVCSYCDASYTRSSNLYAHVRLKHGNCGPGTVVKCD